MIPSGEGANPLWFLVLVFISTVLVIEGLYSLWRSAKGPEASKVRKRLHALAAGAGNSNATRVLKQRLISEVPFFERFLLQSGYTERLERWIYQTGLTWTVSRLLLLSMGAGGLGFLIASMVAHQPFAISAAAGGLTALVPTIILQNRRKRRLARLEAQLPDALDLLTRALRSGNTFASGLQMVSDEMPDPIAGEFGIVQDEINFGVSVQQALENLTARVPLTDLRYFAVAVLIQREAGGNLTEVLGNLSKLVRERLKLLAKIRVLSSEGRMSAWTLIVMPFALGGLMAYFNPKFMTPLWTDPIGISILKALAVLMAVGILVMRKIVRIRV